MTFRRIRNHRAGLALCLWLCLGMCLCLCMASITAPNAWATTGDKDMHPQKLALKTALTAGTASTGALTVSDLSGAGYIAVPASEDRVSFLVTLSSAASSETVSVSASGSLVDVASEYRSFTLWPGSSRRVYCEIRGDGTDTVTVTCGKDVVKLEVCAYQVNNLIYQVSKHSTDEVAVSWGPVWNTSGAYIQRARADSHGNAIENYTTVKTVVGAYESTTLKADWDARYVYRAIPFTDFKSKRYSSSDVDKSLWGIAFTLPTPTVKVTSVEPSGLKALKVSWDADEAATSFAVYRSTSENRGYKQIGTTKRTFHLDKSVKKGGVYYYKVKATFGQGKAVMSGSFGKLVPKKAKVLRKKLKKNLRLPFVTGAYGQTWDYVHRTTLLESNVAHPDQTIYYAQGSRLVTVCYANNALRVYKFTSAGKLKSKKKIKLPKHACWGGVYHAPDGNNYVALGFMNNGESKNKAVIKVFKYNKNWKKGKAAVITGAASNGIMGIREPFAFGSASFDMLENGTLYMHTSRAMFRTSDGKVHQSNIAFSINTKTMTAKTDNVSYASHSFNQRVRFKDGSLYLADHGDAYPRAIQVTMQDGYGSAKPVKKTVNAFEFEGKIGDNKTGAKMCGMEVSSSHVLVCGTSEPHGYEVANTEGFGYPTHNVFVAAVNRTTGESQVKWLTSLDPDSKKKSVGECRVVKLSDDRFAVLYATTAGNWKKPTFHYTVIDGAGNKVISKTYSKIFFSGASQPLLWNGSIYWTECATVSGGGRAKLYRIPAL